MININSDESAWTGISGTLSSGPFILRHISDMTPRPGYGVLLCIIWIYAEEDSGALPDESESQVMANFEDLLVEHFGSDQLAILTAALTFDGARQWVWYTSDISECANRLNNLPPTEERYPIELTTEEDPDWNYLNKSIVGAITQ